MEIPQTDGMRVPGIIYAGEQLMRDSGMDESIRQVANVAHLPGIVRRSLAMPDMHWGYGFSIGAGWPLLIKVAKLRSLGCIKG